MREDDTLASSRYQSPPSGATSSDSSGPSSGPRKHTCTEHRVAHAGNRGQYLQYRITAERQFQTIEDARTIMACDLVEIAVYGRKSQAIRSVRLRCVHALTHAYRGHHIALRPAQHQCHRSIGAENVCGTPRLVNGALLEPLLDLAAQARPRACRVHQRRGTVGARLLVGHLRMYEDARPQAHRGEQQQT